MSDSHIDPERAQFDAFKALPRNTVIHMLNLVRFKAAATYPDGHSHAGRGLTGAEAYRHYSADSGPIFQRVGGRVIWSGTMEAMVIGPDAEHWDATFIAEYPNSGAFMEMVTDPAYREAVVHRQAAVETSRLIRCTPKASRSETVFG